jgi:hypothetical protein
MFAFEKDAENYYGQICSAVLKILRNEISDNFTVLSKTMALYH